MNVNPITLADFKHVWPVLEADLEMIGLTDIELVGSTGKKPVMGDVDVAGRCKDGRDGLYARAVKVFGEDSVTKIGGNIVSIVYLQDVPAFQVDVMVGDPKYLRWARFGSSQDPHHPDFSPVKSSARNVLLNIITRFMSQAKLPYSELDRVRWSIDFDKGLYEVTQTKRGKKGRVLKDWKTTERYLMTSDPDRIARWMFGKGVATANTTTFEGIVGALFQSMWREQAPEILRTFAVEIRDLAGKVPHMLGDEPEKVLAYIDTIAARRQV
jgi:hypothetical protein